MRASDALAALAVFVGAALQGAPVAAQAPPPQRCVLAADGGIYSGGWGPIRVQVLTATTRLDCPLSGDLSGGLDWAIVYHAVNGDVPPTLVPGNPYPHLTWSRAFGAWRPSVRVGLVPSASGTYNEFGDKGRKRALAANGDLEPWLYLPATQWLVLQTGVVLDGPFLLQLDGALAGHTQGLDANGLTGQFTVALGARLYGRVDLGARLGLSADLLGYALPSLARVEFSAAPFARLRFDRWRVEANLVVNLGPAVPPGFQEKAFWSTHLVVGADL